MDTLTQELKGHLMNWDSKGNKYKEEEGGWFGYLYFCFSPFFYGGYHIFYPRWFIDWVFTGLRLV